MSSTSGPSLSLSCSLWRRCLSVYPFSKLLFQSFFPKGGGFSLENYEKFFSKRYYINGLTHSMLICVCTTVLGTLIGIPMAYVSTRFNIWGKKLITLAVVLSMLSPPFIGAYSWVLLLGRAGFITELLEKIGIHIGSIYGFKGILLVFTLKLMPYVYMYVSTALKNFDSSLEEASESLSVHGFKRIINVTLPVIMPTILSAAIIVFMTSLADFGTPMLIGEGYSTLPVLIYEKYLSEVSSNASFASTLSVIIVACSLLVLALQKWIIARKNYTMSAMRPPEVVKLSTGKRILATAFVGFIAFLAVLPQITVIITSFLKTNGPLFVRGFSLDSYRAILYKLSDNIRNTFTFSFIAIIFMMVNRHSAGIHHCPPQGGRSQPAGYAHHVPLRHPRLRAWYQPNPRVQHKADYPHRHGADHGGQLYNSQNPLHAAK